jgi:dihydroorotate dehydrogenase
MDQFAGEIQDKNAEEVAAYFKVFKKKCTTLAGIVLMPLFLKLSADFHAQNIRASKQG